MKLEAVPLRKRLRVITRSAAELHTIQRLKEYLRGTLQLGGRWKQPTETAPEKIQKTIQ